MLVFEHGYPLHSSSGGQSVKNLDALVQKKVNTTMHKDSRLIRVQQ